MQSTGSTGQAVGAQQMNVESNLSGLSLSQHVPPVPVAVVKGLTRSLEQVRSLSNMADPVSLLASILAISTAGVQAGKVLLSLTAAYGVYDNETTSLANELRHLSQVLLEVHDVVNESLELILPRALSNANDILQECQSIFDEIHKMIGKFDGVDAGKWWGRVRLKFDQSRVLPLRARLESLKSTLTLLLSTMRVAKVKMDRRKTTYSRALISKEKLLKHRMETEIVTNTFAISQWRAIESMQAQSRKTITFGSVRDSEWLLKIIPEFDRPTYIPNPTTMLSWTTGPAYDNFTPGQDQAVKRKLKKAVNVLLDKWTTLDKIDKPGSPSPMNLATDDDSPAIQTGTSTTGPPTHSHRDQRLSSVTVTEVVTDQPGGQKTTGPDVKFAEPEDAAVTENQMGRSNVESTLGKKRGATTATVEDEFDEVTVDTNAKPKRTSTQVSPLLSNASTRQSKQSSLLHAKLANPKSRKYYATNTHSDDESSSGSESSFGYPGIYPTYEPSRAYTVHTASNFSQAAPSAKPGWTSSTYGRANFYQNFQNQTQSTPFAAQPPWSNAPTSRQQYPPSNAYSQPYGVMPQYPAPTAAPRPPPPLQPSDLWADGWPHHIDAPSPPTIGDVSHKPNIDPNVVIQSMEALLKAQAEEDRIHREQEQAAKAKWEEESSRRAMQAEEERKAAEIRLIQDTVKATEDRLEEERATARERAAREAAKFREKARKEAWAQNVSGDVPSAVLKPESAIYFTSSTGNRYRFPYDKCRIWNRMQKMILKAHAAEGIDLESTAHDSHVLLDSDGNIILPEFWEDTVYPGMICALGLRKDLVDSDHDTMLLQQIQGSCHEQSREATHHMFQQNRFEGYSQQLRNGNEKPEDKNSQSMHSMSTVTNRHDDSASTPRLQKPSPKRGQKSAYFETESEDSLSSHEADPKTSQTLYAERDFRRHVAPSEDWHRRPSKRNAQFAPNASDEAGSIARMRQDLLDLVRRYSGDTDLENKTSDHSAYNHHGRGWSTRTAQDLNNDQQREAQDELSPLQTTKAARTTPNSNQSRFTGAAGLQTGFSPLLQENFDGTTLITSQQSDISSVANSKTATELQIEHLIKLIERQEQNRAARQVAEKQADDEARLKRLEEVLLSIGPHSSSPSGRASIVHDDQQLDQAVNDNSIANTGQQAKRPTEVTTAVQSAPSFRRMLRQKLRVSPSTS